MSMAWSKTFSLGLSFLRSYFKKRCSASTSQNEKISEDDEMKAKS